MLDIQDYLTSNMTYNDSDSDCHLSSGTLLGKIQLLNSTTSITSVTLSSLLGKISADNTHSFPTYPIERTTSSVHFITTTTAHLNDRYQHDSFAALLTKYSSLLDVTQSTLATTSMNHAIRTQDHAPITTKPYPQSLKQHNELKEHIQTMMQVKQIRSSNSPWFSPTLLVAKPNGSTRFVVDFRKLNQITIKDEYSLPYIEDTLNQLAEYSFFFNLTYDPVIYKSLFEK